MSLSIFRRLLCNKNKCLVLAILFRDLMQSSGIAKFSTCIHVKKEFAVDVAYETFTCQLNDDKN